MEEDFRTKLEDVKKEKINVQKGEQRENASQLTRIDIAARVMEVDGVIISILIIWKVLLMLNYVRGIYGLVYLIVPFMLFGFAESLLTRKKWAWYASVILLLVLISFLGYLCFFYLIKIEKDRNAITIGVLILILILPFILLLLDRKHFFKIAT